MKRVALLLFLAGWLVPLASAQDHFQLGAYADYFRISQTKTNLAGLGVRAGYKAFSRIMLEGEMSYDFEQAFTENFSTTPTEPSCGAIYAFCMDSLAPRSWPATVRFVLSSRSKAVLSISGWIPGLSTAQT